MRRERSLERRSLTQVLTRPQVAERVRALRQTEILPGGVHFLRCIPEVEYCNILAASRLGGSFPHDQRPPTGKFTIFARVLVNRNYLGVGVKSLRCRIYF